MRGSVQQKGAILANAWASGAVVLLSVRKRGKWPLKFGRSDGQRANNKYGPFSGAKEGDTDPDRGTVINAYFDTYEMFNLALIRPGNSKSFLLLHLYYKIIIASYLSCITFMSVALFWYGWELRNEKSRVWHWPSHFLPTWMESKVDECNRSANAFYKVTLAMGLYSAPTVFPFLTYK